MEAEQFKSRTGRIIGGRYRLCRLLGAGGMAEVYEAEHTVTLRRVALKLTRGSWVRRTPAAEARFVREAQAVAAVRHPHVVEVIDAGREDDGGLFLVFELLRGADLETTLRNRDITCAELVRLGIQLVHALGAVHRQGYVHCDVKPANLFVVQHAGERHLVLLDFGITERLSDAQTPGANAGDGTVTGTVEYMSPEQAAGRPMDPRSDLWAAAAVLFRGLTGRAPFAGGPIHATMLGAATKPAPEIRSFRRDLPAGLAGVIDRALSRSPHHRYENAADMARALAESDLTSLRDARVPPSAIAGSDVITSPSLRAEPITERTPLPDLEGFGAHVPTLIVRARRHPRVPPPKSLITGPVSALS